MHLHAASPCNRLDTMVLPEIFLTQSISSAPVYASNARGVRLSHICPVPSPLYEPTLSIHRFYHQNYPVIVFRTRYPEVYSRAATALFNSAMRYYVKQLHPQG